RFCKAAAFCNITFVSGDWASRRTKTLRPILFYVRNTCQELTRDPIENIVETIRVWPANHFALKSVDQHIREYWSLSRVPIMFIVGSELKVPCELSRTGIQRNYTVSKKIVSGTCVA